MTHQYGVVSSTLQIQHQLSQQQTSHRKMAQVLATAVSNNVR
jgi:hypothetical protein